MKNDFVKKYFLFEKKFAECLNLALGKEFWHFLKK